MQYRRARSKVRLCAPKGDGLIWWNGLSSGRRRYEDMCGGCSYEVPDAVEANWRGFGEYCPADLEIFSRLITNPSYQWYFTT